MKKGNFKPISPLKADINYYKGKSENSLSGNIKNVHKFSTQPRFNNTSSLIPSPPKKMVRNNSAHQSENNLWGNTMNKAEPYKKNNSLHLSNLSFDNNIKNSDQKINKSPVQSKKEVIERCMSSSGKKIFNYKEAENVIKEIKFKNDEQKNQFTKSLVRNFSNSNDLFPISNHQDSATKMSEKRNEFIRYEPEYFLKSEKLAFDNKAKKFQNDKVDEIIKDVIGKKDKKSFVARRPEIIKDLHRSTFNLFG